MTRWAIQTHLERGDCWTRWRSASGRDWKSGQKRKLRGQAQELVPHSTAFLQEKPRLALCCRGHSASPPQRSSHLHRRATSDHPPTTWARRLATARTINTASPGKEAQTMNSPKHVSTLLCRRQEPCRLEMCSNPKRGQTTGRQNDSRCFVPKSETG